MEWIIMKRYALLKNLLKEAHRLASAYGCDEFSELLGTMDISLNMARNSFVAHSVYAGYDRVIVERIAGHVFTSFENQN
jgi:hypothetical protein